MVNKNVTKEQQLKEQLKYQREQLKYQQTRADIYLEDYRSATKRIAMLEEMVDWIDETRLAQRKYIDKLEKENKNLQRMVDFMTIVTNKPEENK